MINSSKTRNFSEPPLWNNRENDAFYEDIKVEGLKKLAQKAGLATACDVKLLSPYWQNANSILDAGAGYGRALAFLLESGFQGPITALERNNTFFQYLKTRYHTQVTLIHDDLKNCDRIKKQFDVVLLLWSALAEFAPKDQKKIVFQLAKLLNKNGKLIIDTLPTNINKPLDTEEFGEQFFLTRTKESIVRTYEARQDEIEYYAKHSGLSNVEVKECLTDTNRIRWLYILS